MEIINSVLNFFFQSIGYFLSGCFLLLLLAFIFGEKVHWKFEVEGFCKAFAKQKVKIKIKELAKKGQIIQIKGALNKEYQNKPIEVFINGFEIATFDNSAKDGTNLKRSKSINIKKPSQGDQLLLVIGGDEVYQEKLV